MKLPIYYKIKSEVHDKVMNVCISDEEVYEETMADKDFWACSPVKLKRKPKEFTDITGVVVEEFRFCEEEMWKKYIIPTYAIPRICEKVLDPDGKLDYYEVPDTFALNEINRNLELNHEDIRNIDKFLSYLYKEMPEGFELGWDNDSCESPFFYRRPAFGLPMDCVYLRIYPKNLEHLKRL